MNDYIDVKLAFSNYIHNIADVIYRYINNDTLKKVLIFPLFFIILVLEAAIFPVALVGAIARWIVVFLFQVSEDRAPMFYTFFVVFIEFFLLYYLMFVILLGLYALFNLASNGIGKESYEINADEFVSRNIEKSIKEKEEIKENEDNIYVINDDNYK